MFLEDHKKKSKLYRYSGARLNERFVEFLAKNVYKGYKKVKKLGSE